MSGYITWSPSRLKISQAMLLTTALIFVDRALVALLNVSNKMSINFSTGFDKIVLWQTHTRPTFKQALTKAVSENT